MMRKCFKQRRQELLCDAGARHYPALKADTLRPLKGKERKEIFELKTTKDYYKEFPGLVRSSFPLYIKSAGIQVSLNQSLLR